MPSQVIDWEQTYVNFANLHSARHAIHIQIFRKVYAMFISAPVSKSQFVSFSTSISSLVAKTPQKNLGKGYRGENHFYPCIDQTVFRGQGSQESR